MDVNDFYKRYHRYMKQQAGEIIYIYRMPQYLFDDCLSAGYVAVCQYLPRWDASKGASPITYLRLAIRKEMASVCRNHLDHRPKCSSVRAERYIMSEEDLGIPTSEHTAYGHDPYGDLPVEETIDLHRALDASLHHNHKSTSHFIYAAFDKFGNTECAIDSGKSRQAVYLTSKTICKHLRKRLTADIC
jgi:hypothetical protein